MALRNTTRMGSLALTLLVAGCGEEDSDTEPVDGPATNGRAAIQARALDEYATRDATRTHCDDVSIEDEEGAEAPPLTDNEVLLLDAAPQCDLERLGLTDTDNIVEGRIIERANVADEPALALCSCTELEASNRIMAPGQSDIIGDLGANERVFGSAPISVDLPPPGSATSTPRPERSRTSMGKCRSRKTGRRHVPAVRPIRSPRRSPTVDAACGSAAASSFTGIRRT